MSLLGRSLNAFRLFEIVHRVCLIQSISCLSKSSVPSNDPINTSTRSLRSCDFEVFGTVQGVFFRKYTQQQATKLNLVGWVQNTEKDTVEGHMEGQETNIDQMKTWLKETGSPSSKITKVQFTNEKSITKLSWDRFHIKR